MIRLFEHKGQLCALILAIAGTLFARVIVADESREVIALTYEVAPGCPTQSVFRDEVDARTSRVIWARPDAGSRAVHVSVTNDSGGFAGRLEITGPGSHRAARQIPGKSCDEVIAVLAWVTALAVDPQASNTPIQIGPSSHEATDSNSSDGTTPTSDATNAAPVGDNAAGNAASVNAFASPSVAQGTLKPSAATTNMQAVIPPPHSSMPAAPWGTQRPFVNESGSSSRQRWRWGAGLRGALMFGLFPSKSALDSLFVELSRSPGLLAPTFRISVSGSAIGWNAAPQGEVRFAWFAGELEGCPLRLELTGNVIALPCALGELGMLRGEGRGVGPATSSTRPWAALGGLVRLAWSPDDRFFFEAYGGLRAPLARDTFVFRAPERIVIFGVPATIGEGGLGAGYRFP